MVIADGNECLSSVYIHGSTSNTGGSHLQSDEINYDFENRIIINCLYFKGNLKVIIIALFIVDFEDFVYHL